MADDIEVLLADWVAEELRESPTSASALGWPDADHGALPDLSAGGFARRTQSDAAWRARFEAVDPSALTLDQGIDRDLVLSALAGRRILEDWHNERRDPTTYLGPCLSGVFTLFLNKVLPEGELAEAAASRLRAVPDLLAAAADQLDPTMAAPLILERGLGQCRAGVTYARDLVPNEVDDPAAKALLAEAGAEAATAFERFADELQKLAAKATGTWALGEERYSALLREKELLSVGSAAELRELGQQQYDLLDAEMSEVALRIDPSCGGDWRAVSRALVDDHPDTPEGMRQEYEDWTEKARQFLIANGIVTMAEGEECGVVPSPHFQRPVLAVASYSQPAAFTPSRKGYFFVPFPPDGTSPEDVERRLASNCRSSIPTIAVHEAYPGHHWHLSWMAGTDRPIRKVVRTAYFAEGWALYAERVMRKAGFFDDPRHDLGHLEARIFRAARIVVDTSLHLGEMTFDEGVAFMRDNANLTEPTAKAEVGRYCTWPTQAASYLTGCLEIERIREGWTGADRAFNDAIAGSGCLPLALAERAVAAAA